MRKFILFYLITPIFSFSQTLDNYNIKYQNIIYEDILNNNLVNDSIADFQLTKILNIVGNPNRFVVKSDENVNNALAISVRGIRYILFNKEFISQLEKNRNNYWANTFILAHEVGHHLKGHTLVSNQNKEITLELERQQELEADEFAGFILSKLGANLEQTLDAINFLSNDDDDTYSDHPAKSKRLKSIEIGFNNASSNLSFNYLQKISALTYQDYFYNAFAKYKKKNFQGANIDFTKAIELNPNSELYFYRAIVKSEILDYEGAIQDYTKAIILEPIFAYYYNRGIMKYKLNNLKGSILDYDKAIELNRNYGNAFYNRALSKYELNDLIGAISDYTISIKLNTKIVDSYYNRGIAKDDLEDFKGAISDFTKTIELEPDNSKAYINRGNSKNSIIDFNGAIQDLTKGLLLNPKSKVGYYNRGLAYYNSKNYIASLKDFNFTIANNPEDGNAYLFRGNIKYILKKRKEACVDWNKSKELGNESAIKLINKICK